MNDHAAIALEKFSSGYNCAQAVLYAFCDELGIARDTALRMACGFGGGMARRQETCGAISGGVLAIGLKHGRGEGQERAVTDETYVKVRELMCRFQAAHGTHLCRSLLDGCDLMTPEGQKQFKEADLMNRTCKRCVTTVVEALEVLL
jgi:C_GCAxxG_C_C family probable redox protein